MLKSAKQFGKRRARNESHPVSNMENIEALLKEPLPLITVEERINKIGDEIPKEHLYHKQFYFEIRPITKVAQTLNASEIMLNFTGQKEQFDGKIILPESEIIIECTRSVECTRSDKLSNEALILEHREKYGRAPAYQLIKASGTKHNRKMEETHLVARPLKDYNNKRTKGLITACVSNIFKAFEQKQKAKYKEFWLIITFDDWFVSKEDLPKFFEKICFRFRATCRQKKIRLTNIFDKVILIGNSIRYMRAVDPI